MPDFTRVAVRIDDRRLAEIDALVADHGFRFPAGGLDASRMQELCRALAVAVSCN